MSSKSLTTTAIWSNPPGGKRYEAQLPMRGHLRIVKKNTAAGGPRWVATFTNIRGEARWVARGDRLATVRRQALEAVR